MKKIILLFILLGLVAASIPLSQNFLKDNPFNKTNSTVTIKDNKFFLLIAKTDKEKEIGLSEKSSLPSDTAMLFSFEKPDYYAFWMRNMKFPIDIIFINKDSIVTIFPNQKPPKDNQDTPILKPEEPADKVLEISEGLSEKYGFKKGDKVKFQNL